MLRKFLAAVMLKKWFERLFDKFFQRNEIFEMKKWEFNTSLEFDEKYGNFNAKPRSFF